MAEERVQRRLAAILAADVAGYSRLMEADEEGTLARMKALRESEIDPRIAAYGGRIFKTTGDGILAEFPSAVDAVRHAVELQRALAGLNADAPEDGRIVFRIGISLGDVMIDGEDLFGNGVNVAARMEGLAEPGGICISGNVQEHVGNALDVTCEDLGAQTVKNIDRPVPCYRVHLAPVAQRPGAAPAPVERASIAVLPFANMSGDSEQEYFSDGIAEDIITALSRARWFRVVSRNSTFAYKGASTDVRQVARELDVRYVLEGSVRKAGNRVRVTAQLIDAQTDNHLWAERYDRELEDIFDVQDEITAAIVVQIGPELRRAELNRATIARPESLNVWDLYQRGWWHMYRKVNPDNQAALDHFRRAAELDPNFGPAHSGIAQACFYLVWFDRVDDRESYNDQGMRAARRAVELDSEDPTARFALGQQHQTRGDDHEALAEYEHAVRLNPFSAEPRLGVGRALVNFGRFSEAASAMEEGIRLCPNDQLTGILMARLAEAKFHLHEYNEAIEWLRQAARQPVAPRMWGQVTLLAALGQADDADGARPVLQDILNHRPNFSLSYVRGHYPMKNPEVLDHLVEGLRKAGVPE